MVNVTVIIPWIYLVDFPTTSCLLIYVNWEEAGKYYRTQVLFADYLEVFLTNWSFAWMSLANTWQGFSKPPYLKYFLLKKTNTLKIITQSMPPCISWHEPVFAWLTSQLHRQLLLFLPCKTSPTLCERLKQLGKVAASLDCAPGGHLRKSTVSFRRLLMLLPAQGRWGETSRDENLPCLGKVPGICTRINTVS